MLARWLCLNPKLLLLDEPTRGIDVGAKAEIQSLINELAERGLGVLMISSELEELTEGSDRVVVLRDGQTVATLDHDHISQNSIMAAMAQSNEENPNVLPDAPLEDSLQKVDILDATPEDPLRSRGVDLSRTDQLQPENRYPATPIASNDPSEGMHNQNHSYSKEVQHGQD